jgi:Flp pilus assembly protein TadD
MAISPMIRLLAALTVAGGLAACQTAPRAPVVAEAQGTLGLDSALRLGDAALAGGDPAAAARVLSAAAAAHPDKSEPARALGDAYFRMRALPEARQTYEGLAAMPGQTATAETGLGRVALAEGDAAEAERHFRAALAAEPRDVIALNGLAVALDLTGRHGEAAPLYAQALAIEPTNRAVMTNQALSRALAGDPRGAAEALDALANGPIAIPQARHNLALAHALSGSFDAADQILTAELSPEQARENLDFYRRVAR